MPLFIVIQGFVSRSCSFDPRTSQHLPSYLGSKGPAIHIALSWPSGTYPPLLPAPLQFLERCNGVPGPWSLPERSDTCRSSLPPPLTCVHGLQIHHPAPGGAKASAPPGPSRLPQPGPRGSQGLLPPALFRRSCRHDGSGCHLRRALRRSSPGSTQRTGSVHSPGEHAARGGGLSHAPWRGPRAWPWAHAKQGICICGARGRERGVEVLPGRVPTLRNTCLSRPRLAVPPQHALRGSDSRGSWPFWGTPGFCLGCAQEK